MTSPTWQHAWDTAQPRIQHLRESLNAQTATSSRVLRVGQLDAELLDQELVQILKEPIAKSLSLVHVRLVISPQPSLHPAYAYRQSQVSNHASTRSLRC
jgi:peroxin-2